MNVVTSKRKPQFTQRSTFLASSAGALASVAVLRTPARAAQFEFKCATNNPVDHPSSLRLSQMWDAVERESGGRIHTQFFPNSQLGNDAAMFSQLRLGALAFFMISAGNLATVVPVADIAFLGFAYKDVDEAIRVLEGPLGGYVRQEVATKNMYAFRSIWNSGMFHIGSNTRPVSVPADLEGFKLRVVESRIIMDLFKGLGASPTPLSANEVYTSLQTKLIDGEQAPLVFIETARWFEVNKYVSLTNHAWSGNWLIANNEAWKSLPGDLQSIVERNNTKFAQMEQRDTKAVDAQLSDKLTKQGLAFNRVDQAPFRARLSPYFQAWGTTFGPAAWNLLQSSLGRRLA